MHSSPVTVTRTWRIQDWASYFYACRFPPEQELDTNFSKSLRLPAKNMNPNPMNGDRRKESGRKLLQEKKTECSVEAAGNDTSWPHLEEEDYIVFCFTEDGDIRVVEDRKREMSCGSDIEIYPANEQEMIISFEKGEEKWRDSDAECAGDEIRDIICTSSSESSIDYNQSNASKRSFAFPVLGWEWAGSPVHIPKQEDSPYLKKHRGGWLFLHCCRS